MHTDQRLLLNADPRLSKYDPMSRILYYDDFDCGYQGWMELIGNYEHTLDTMLPPYMDLRPPQLSNGTMWDTGSHGSLEGMYSLKVASRPQEGHIGTAIKRATFRKRGPIRFETYFTFKPEATELLLMSQDVRACGILFDIQDEECRWMPHLRYLNARNGEYQQKWQFKSHVEPMLPIGTTGEIRSHFHLEDGNWQDVPDGKQKLCYNEIPTKYNWHYLRLDLDLEKHTIDHIQCNQKVFNLDGVEPMVLKPVPNAWDLLNVVFWVESNTGKRSFLFLDSCVMSGEF